MMTADAIKHSSVQIIPLSVDRALRQVLDVESSDIAIDPGSIEITIKPFDDLTRKLVGEGYELLVKAIADVDDRDEVEKALDNGDIGPLIKEMAATAAEQRNHG